METVTPSSPATPVILEALVPPEPKESGIPVHKLNNPETLGVSIRLKDIALIVTSTALAGYIGLNVKNSFQLFLAVIPIHASVFYGITRSYFSTRTIAVAFTITATLVSSSVTAALAFLITPDSEKHKILFKPVAWFIEQKAASFVNAVGASVGALTPDVSATEQKVELYVRGIIAAGITLLGGSMSTVCANIFRALTAKRFY